tara:strand:+ start:6758 stop:7345 length:588 start_codon:yes stop_codon:yes gene_type:complete
MDSILEKNLYLFKEHVGFLKAHNNYDIYDPESKEMILHCREKNLNAFYKIVRLFRNYKRMTPFEIEIKGLDDKKILKVKKGFSFFLSKIQVFDENDNLVGIFKQRLSFNTNFDMLDKREKLVCKLKGNFIGWNFKFLRGDTEVGLVTKKWAGIGKEMFTSADNYILEIKNKVEKDSPLRLLILAAVICIDMVIKE